MFFLLLWALLIHNQGVKGTSNPKHNVKSTQFHLIPWAKN